MAARLVFGIFKYSFEDRSWHKDEEFFESDNAYTDLRDYFLACEKGGCYDTVFGLAIPCNESKRECKTGDRDASYVPSAAWSTTRNITERMEYLKQNLPKDCRDVKTIVSLVRASIEKDSRDHDVELPLDLKEFSRQDPIGLLLTLAAVNKLKCEFYLVIDSSPGLLTTIRSLKRSIPWQWSLRKNKQHPLWSKHTTYIFIYSWSFLFSFFF